MTKKEKNNTVLIPFYETNFGQAYLGDSLELMKQIPDNSINRINRKE